MAASERRDRLVVHRGAKVLFWLAAASACVVLAAATAPAARAYETFGDHHLIYGVGSYGNDVQHYWIASTATDYETQIDAAMHDWIYTTDYWGITTPIYYTKTSYQSGSRMDLHQVSNVNTWWGLTKHYTGDTLISPPPTVNWVWGKILLDGDYVHCPNKKGVIAHEMGHVMGLAHVNSGTALMRWDIAGLDIHRAQPDDLHGINHLY